MNKYDQIKMLREALEDLRSIGESAERGAYSKARLITKILYYTQKGLRAAEALSEEPKEENNEKV